jgi:hypothetical protein
MWHPLQYFSMISIVGSFLSICYYSFAVNRANRGQLDFIPTVYVLQTIPCRNTKEGLMALLLFRANPAIKNSD